MSFMPSLLPTKFLPMFFLFFTALGFAKPSANLQTIDQLFSNAVSREMVPGISVAIADKDGVVLFQPGTDSKYSTFAFSLIAAAMEGADKKRSFKQIIQQEVFTPLDMQNSVFDDQADIIPLRQRPYVVRDGKLLNAPSQIIHTNTLAEDLSLRLPTYHALQSHTLMKLTCKRPV
jgi:CubicO group peptidase (beta-lactamase class C family)